MTVWVTGAHGFLGRHVARCFAGAGHRVAGAGHGAWNAAERRSWGIGTWIDGDIGRPVLERLAEAAGPPNIVFHAAGSGAVAPSVKAPLSDFARTVVSTTELLEFLRCQAPRAKLLLPSSAAVYGAQPRGPIPEDAALRPVSPYGSHKLIAEEMCRSYARSFGVRSVIIRYFSVYGPELRKQLLWDLATKAVAGPAELELFGTGAETRDMIHVTDAARLALAASEAETGDVLVVNGGSGRATTVREIAEGLLRRLGFAGPIRFSGAGRPGDPQHYEADLRQARLVGYVPEWRLGDGLDDYARWIDETMQPTARRRALS